MAFTKASVEAKKLKYAKSMATLPAYAARKMKKNKEESIRKATEDLYTWYSRWKYYTCNVPPVPFEFLSEEEVLSWRRLALQQWCRKKINGKKKRREIRKATMERNYKFITTKKTILWREYEAARALSKFFWIEKEDE